jgi:transposase
MAKALPKEQREKIVSAYKNGLGTAEKIAEIFGIKARSVFKYLQIERETGDLTPIPSPGRPPILTPDNLKIIRDIILLKPDGTLSDYKDQFYQKTGIEVTIVTIHYAAKKLNFKRKKKVFSHPSKNDQMFWKRG